MNAQGEDINIAKLLKQWESSINSKNLEDYLNIFDEKMKNDLEVSIKNSPDEEKKYLEYYAIRNVSVDYKRILKLTQDDLIGLFKLDTYCSPEYLVYYLTFDAQIFDNMKSKYTKDGKNFAICVLVDQNGDYKITDFINAPVKSLIIKDITLNTDEENIIRTEIMKYKEKVDAINKMNLDRQSYENQLNTLIATTIVPPQTIRIKSYTKGQITTVDFNTYVKDVLPNEWDSDQVVYDSTKPSSTYLWESLYCGAVMVKTYGWYMATLGWHRSKGFDVYDDDHDQVYLKDSRYKMSSDYFGRKFAWGSMCSSAIDSVSRSVIWNTDTDNVAEVHYNQDFQNSTYTYNRMGYNYTQIMNIVLPSNFYTRIY